MKTTPMNYATGLAAALVLALGLYGCGGGGSSGGTDGGGTTMPQPEAVDLSNVTPGFMAGSGTVTVAAGQSEDHGDISFACAAGGRDCEVTVMVDASGDITATSTGGTVTAMNSADYNTAVTPTMVSLSSVTPGFVAGSGTVTVAAGQSEDHGDISFACAAGGRDCEVTVMVDASGDITATSTGGTVTAMNSADYQNAVTPMNVDLAGVTAGFMAGSGTVTVAAGQSEDHGDISFACAAGGRDCEVTVMVDVNGAVTATSTGGMVTAMNSADYQNAVTPMNVDLAGVTAGFMADAGTVTIEAGQSEEHGGIAFSCAAGGRDCEVTVMVDANGAVTATSTGGMVTAVNAPGYQRPLATEWRNNTTAEDLLDHWNDSEALRTVLALSPLNQTDIESRRTVIRDLIDAAGSDPTTSGTVFRNVNPDEIEIIGERDGITYGQWKGGPAGTLNIGFDWQFAPNIDSKTRAQMERAGKFWSHRILDDLGTHTVTAGTTIQAAPAHAGAVPITVTYARDFETNGVLVTVLHATTDPLSSGGPISADITPNDYQPWHGVLTLSQSNINERGSIGNWWFVHVLGHEIGHIIGVVNHESGWNVPVIEQYINRQDATFEGPESQRANGGNPVPFQWLDSNRNVVAPFTPGATVDYAHLGVCSSLMAYCNEPREVYEPAQIDFAYLDDIGYEILGADTASEPELYGYGAWGQYSAWGAGAERVLTYVDDGLDVVAQDQLRVGVDAFGVAPSISLAELHTPESLGNATWAGSLIGVDLGSAHLPPVFGDAELGVDLETLDGTAQFDNLTVHTDGEAVDFRSPTLSYDVEVTGNSFSDADGHLAGSFFGPAHEEMAGILNDRTPAVDLLAGFGGTR